MINALKFVQGAVAKKDFVPALTHFRIQNGKVKGFNGTLGICSPIAVDLDVAPRAVQFVKAIEACTEEIALHVADNGKLCVRSGKFKTFVECDEVKNFPDFEPTGKIVELDKKLISALKILEPFIAEDATRPWACGILLDGESAMATNNIVFIEHWLGYRFPCRVNLPALAVRELIRIKEDPIKLQMTEDRLVFHYKGGQWLSTQVLTTPWPDMQPLLAKITREGQEKPPVELWEALEQLLPFADEINRCFFQKGEVSTVAQSDVAGTSIKVKGMQEGGSYNTKHLIALKKTAETFAFSKYPAPIPFFGGYTRGLVSGIRT